MDITRNVSNVQVGIEGITYAGNHGLEILHPDGSKFVHPMPMELQDNVVKLLKALQEQVRSFDPSVCWFRAGNGENL